MFRIYYAGKLSKMNGHCRDDFTNKVIDLTFGWNFYCKNHDGLDLDETHTYVATTTLDSPEDIFESYQGMWVTKDFSDLIKESDATHTSMSVGDVLVECGTGRVLFCDNVGFVEIEAVESEVK